MSSKYDDSDYDDEREEVDGYDSKCGHDNKEYEEKVTRKVEPLELLSR